MKALVAILAVGAQIVPLMIGGRISFAVATVFLQALPFGAVHFVSGVPNGWWGLAMAGVYGLMLGALRRKSTGLLSPWIAHTAADGCIFVGIVLLHLS